MKENVTSGHWCKQDFVEWESGGGFSFGIEVETKKAFTLK